jgi:hypothetical protein
VQAIDALSASGSSPGLVIDLFQTYGPYFRSEMARSPAGMENLWKKLSRYLKREKAAGKSDDVIKRELDIAFRCK